MGDIAASRALQVGIRAFPNLRSPIAWLFLAAELCLEKCFESFRNYISERLGILFTSQSPHHSGKASWRRVLTLLFSNFTKKNFRFTRVSWFCSDGFVTRTLFLVPPVFRGCGSVPGSWAPRCCRHNFIVEIMEYLSFADIENLFYAVVGEITSTLPSTGVGVREYFQNSYNRCFSKVEVNDFRRFLGYVLKDGYIWM